MRYGISEVNEFKSFCKKFEETLKNDFAKMYMIDESDIFFREPDNNMSIVREGDVFTWKIGIVVSLGEKRQIIKIDLENREPLTSKMQFFGRLTGDSIQHNDIYLNVETKEEMLVNKFISLFQRNRLQYRDFYDIGFLSKLNGNTIDETLSFKKIRRKFSDEQFMDKLERRKNIFDDMEMFTSSFRYELERFIPKHLAAISLSDQMIEYTKNMVERYVNTYCNQMMHEMTECDDEPFRLKP